MPLPALREPLLHNEWSGRSSGVLNWRPPSATPRHKPPNNVWFCNLTIDHRITAHHFHSSACLFSRSTQPATTRTTNDPPYTRRRNDIHPGGRKNPPAAAAVFMAHQTTPCPRLLTPTIRLLFTCLRRAPAPPCDASRSTLGGSIAPPARPRADTAR